MQYPIKKRIVMAGRTLLGKEADRETRQAIPPITDDEVREAKLFFPMVKFFIFGHARSGTTMLARLVRLHPEIHCNYQAHFFTRPPLLEALVQDQAVGEWLCRPSFRWNRGKDLSPVVLRAVSDFILEREARKEGKKIVGDKSPNNLMGKDSVELLHKVYPDAYLIYIIRDGRDAAVSHRFQAFIDKPEHLTKEDLQIRSDFVRNAEAFLSGERSIFTTKWIGEAAQSWVQNVQETSQLGKTLFGDNFLIIRFEDLLGSAWNEMTKVWGFLTGKLPDNELHSALLTEMKQNPDAEWQIEKAEDIAHFIRKGKQGSWKNYFSDQDKKIYHQIAWEALSTWGYARTF